MPRATAIGIGLTVVSAFAFGSGPLFGKSVYAAGVRWDVLMAWRFLVGAVLAWAWLLARPSSRARLAAMRPRHALGALGLGVFYAGNSGTYFAGLESVPASLAALIVYVYPAIVAVISLQVGTPLRGRRAWGALGLALVGVALAVGNIDAGNVPPIGALALIGASPVIYSVWIVLSARLSGEARSGVGSQAGGGADPMAAGVVMLSATAATYWIGTVALGRPVLPSQVPAQAWLGLFGIGAISTFLAVLTFYAAAHRIGAARASLISTVEPIWTIALASVLFAESLAPLQLLGGALILLGVVISQTGSAASMATVELRIADE